MASGSGRMRVAGAGGPAPGGATLSGAEGLIEVEARDGVRLGSMPRARVAACGRGRSVTQQSPFAQRANRRTRPYAG